MAVYSVVGYFNTGFGGGNIPDSPAIVRLATSKTFPSNWLLQNKDLTLVRLNATWGEVENIDYVAIGSSFYFVAGIRMQTEVCAELSLQLDGITTAGGINALSLTGGWCARAHASSDALFSNTIPEPWTPSNNLIIDGIKTLADDGGVGITFLGSTIELSTIDYIADEYLDSTGNVVCYVPKINPISQETTVTQPLPRGYTRSFQLPNSVDVPPVNHV